MSDCCAGKGEAKKPVVASCCGSETGKEKAQQADMLFLQSGRRAIFQSSGSSGP